MNRFCLRATIGVALLFTSACAKIQRDFEQAFDQAAHNMSKPEPEPLIASEEQLPTLTRSIAVAYDAETQYRRVEFKLQRTHDFSDWYKIPIGSELTVDGVLMKECIPHTDASDCRPNEPDFAQLHADKPREVLLGLALFSFVRELPHFRKPRYYSESREVAAHDPVTLQWKHANGETETYQIPVSLPVTLKEENGVIQWEGERPGSASQVAGKVELGTLWRVNGETHMESYDTSTKTGAPWLRIVPTSQGDYTYCQFSRTSKGNLLSLEGSVSAQFSSVFRGTPAYFEGHAPVGAWK
jgi:hypothetical protein